MPDLATEIKTQSLLRGLEHAEVVKIASLLEAVRFAKDDYVFKESTPCRGVYMIRSGRIEISKTTADGWRQPLVLLARDHFLGEIALLERSNHATDARAIDPAELYVLADTAFEGLERTDPVLMLKIIKNIAIIGGLNVRRMNEKFLKALVNY